MAEEQVTEVQNSNEGTEYPAGTAPAVIAQAELAKLAAKKEVEKEVQDEPVRREEVQEVKEVEGQEQKVVEKQAEEAPAEKTQAEKDREYYNEIMASRAQKRGEQKPTEPEPQQPVVDLPENSKESLLARGLSGDVTALNDLFNAMGQKKFEEFIKYRVSQLDTNGTMPDADGVAPQTSAAVPDSVKKELDELRSFKNEMLEFRNQQNLMHANAVEQQQLGLIKEAIASDPDEYAILQNREQAVRQFALEVMASGREISPLEAVRIMSNQMKSELMNNKDTILRMLGMDTAKSEDVKEQKETIEQSQAPATITNQTETNNTPSEPKVFEMPSTQQERLLAAEKLRRKMLKNRKE